MHNYAHYTLCCTYGLLLLLCCRPTWHDTNTARGLTDKMHNKVHNIVIIYLQSVFYWTFS